MGSTGVGNNDFSDTPPGHTQNWSLQYNVYWNGGSAIPTDAGELINYTDDANAITADPVLPALGGLVIPRWNPGSQTFAGGFTQIRQAFVHLAETYGAIGVGSSAIGQAQAGQKPADDILGNPRPAGNHDLGAVNFNGGTLPVEGLIVTASQVPEGIEVKWHTAAEINLAYFQVERATDGRMFQSLAQVSNRGLPNQPAAYQYTDRHPPEGRLYYRLKYVHLDGSFAYSSTVTTSSSTQYFPITYYPNPVKNSLFLTSHTTSATSCSLLNHEGKLFAVWDVLGGRKIELDLRALSPGHYWLVVESSHRKQVFPIVKL